MYCRQLFSNAIKSVRTHAMLNCISTNLRQPCTRNNIYACRMGKMHITMKNYCSNYKSHKHRVKFFMIAGGAFFGLFDFGQTDDDETSDLIMTIKRSILLIQKEEFEKAEQMLHLALRQAQTVQHYDGITYVYDVMANLAFSTGNYKKAETLFISVLQRLISKGAPQDDLQVVHISLKIAKIYDNTGNVQKAEDGYKFCMDNLQKHLMKDSEDETVATLLGTTLEWYATMLFSQARYIEALKYLTEAYELSTKIHGEEHEQTVILLSDLGTVNCVAGEYDEAIKYLTRAAEIGEKLPDMVDLGSVHVNLGQVFIKKGLYEVAKEYCKRGMNLAESRNDKDSAIEAESCLSEIKKLMS